MDKNYWFYMGVWSICTVITACVYFSEIFKTYKKITVKHVLISLPVLIFTPLAMVVFIFAILGSLWNKSKDMIVYPRNNSNKELLMKEML